MRTDVAAQKERYDLDRITRHLHILPGISAYAVKCGHSRYNVPGTGLYAKTDLCLQRTEAEAFENS